MSKTIKIFIITFLITIIILLGIYFWINKDKKNTETEENHWYQSFNPFKTLDNIDNNNQNNNDNSNINNTNIETDIPYEEFEQITDFAIAGASFIEDKRFKENTTNEPIIEQITTPISSIIIDGRKQIQQILNEKLELKPALILDGVFGKSTTKAINDFQKNNNLKITGKIDIETSPFFVKISEISKNENNYENVPSIRYVERKNGHIYKMFLDNKTKEKISNTTIPSIYEAFFDKTGQTVVYRYLSSDNTITSYMATLGTANGEFLPENITDFSSSFNKDKFFYIKESNNESFGFVGDMGSPKINVVFNSPFREWISSWDQKDKVYITSKSSYTSKGSMFVLNKTNKTIKKVVGGIVGLTTLISKDGNTVLFSESTDKGPVLKVFDIANNTTKDLDTIGLAEKCVWGNNNIDIYCAVPDTIFGNKYPDNWYKGLISFNNFFVRINTKTQEKETISDIENEKQFDSINLFLDKEENNLFFTNKKDYTLWSLKLNI